MGAIVLLFAVVNWWVRAGKNNTRATQRVTCHTSFYVDSLDSRSHFMSQHIYSSLLQQTLQLKVIHFFVVPMTSSSTSHNEHTIDMRHNERSFSHDNSKLRNKYKTFMSLSQSVFCEFRRVVCSESSFQFSWTINKSNIVCVSQLWSTDHHTIFDNSSCSYSTLHWCYCDHVSTNSLFTVRQDWEDQKSELPTLVTKSDQRSEDPRKNPPKNAVGQSDSTTRRQRCERHSDITATINQLSWATGLDEFVRMHMIERASAIWSSGRIKFVQLTEICESLHVRVMSRGDETTR